MSLSLDPNRTALLSMDFQNVHMGRVPDAEALIARQSAALAAARGAGLTVAHVWIAFAADDVLAGQMAKRIPAEVLLHYRTDAASAQIHADVAPVDGEIVVRKTRVGPFSTTDLHEQLQARGIDTLILTGVATGGVVLSGVRDAHDRDYGLIVVSDLVADPDPEVDRVLVGKVIANQASVLGSAELLAAL